jgi:dipeptidase
MLASSQTTASWVSDLRAGPRHWATATSAPCTSLFKPVDLDSPLDLGSRSMNMFDDRNLWWRHELLHRRTMTSHATLLARYRRDRDRTEAQWLADPPPSSAAFEDADRLEATWLTEVDAARLADTRPSWIRRSWRSIDRTARIEPAMAAAAGPGPPR